MYHLSKTFCRRKSVFLKNEREFSASGVLSTAITKVLIANRGEIACRVMRTARKLGVKTVAVYSDADRDSMHADLADESYYIGPSASSESYLRQDKIISVAKKTKCTAIHPGYGFLSENMEFAQLCQREKIIFIGPPASAIRDMGIKSTSKEIMSRAGVPIIEGYHSSDQSNEILLAEARKIGFPVMIKAVRGGGGKGMRIAEEENKFFEALESARTEAIKSFGDSDVLLEKYVLDPRHVEVQVFADTHGNAVYLFERDCSVQRRHQKIIEEAPAPGLSEETRIKLGEAAVRAAKAVGYVGAGTVEFIMDQNDHSFYFMEMNTRLQVEHPVTEAITGLDLVEWQLKVAAGEKLPLAQRDITIRGHAFEARIYAEDPRGGFLPRAGPLLHLTPPEADENVRVETGVRQGDQVSVYYDPMIAKLVVWGSDRSEALRLLKIKLSDYNIAGVETNIEFLKDLCGHKNFEAGAVHTGFIEECRDSLFPKLQVPSDILCQAALAAILYEDLVCLKAAVGGQNPWSPFNTELGFRVNHSLSKQFKFLFDDKKLIVDVKYTEPEVYSMQVNGIGPWRKVIGTLTQGDNILELRSEVEGKKTKTRIVKINDELHIFTNDRAWKLNTPQPEFLSKINIKSDLTGAAVSPIPGVVDKILVSRNDSVKKGDALLVIVAMKMEHLIRASSDGVVEEILCVVGDTVAKDRLLVKITEESK
ncbi:methylcrotonoyl-CoA carboxylase subunit alpha, mitochondrial [Microplitis demolitor]|uniref:methylcrotonoyl-CoA carboxylase subunit alpha, mitochondrial n=1 Tax=Microplitis demolitor TaxID=69319 RepID=UPI0004CCE6D8|nr:methylcrotonoyl-CoA carboxylase subunit alpha, mitochondrial [Microplitis demolitor]